MNIVRADSFYNADGWYTERLVMEIDGHDVQVIRHNWNDDLVLVYVDQHAALAPMNEALIFIASRI